MPRRDFLQAPARQVWAYRLVGVGVLVVVALVAACGGSDEPAAAATVDIAATEAVQPEAPAAATSQSLAAENRSVSFTPSNALVINPERGLHPNATLVSDIWGRTDDYAYVRQRGASVVRGIVRMDNYRASELSDTFLGELRKSFSEIRAAGVKVVPVFMYNFPETVDPSGALDAPIDLVERHIAQLAPVFAENEDVLMGLHGGFIGAWGEWHSSSNGLDTPENKQRVMRALLKAIPTSRWLQLRYPGDTTDFFPSPLNEQTAFAGTDASRIGFANQCFVVNSHDAGTWLDRQGNPSQALRDYMASATPYMAVGGETCQVVPDPYQQPSGCENTLSELTRYHWSFLNMDFYEPTLERWRAEGCYDTIDKRLGYRFELQSVRAPSIVRPGAELRVNLALRNGGFAGPSNARGLELVLRRRSDGALLRVDWTDRADPRRWYAGDAVHQVTISAGIPANAATGVYDLLLNLPDPAPSLITRPDYSIRIASLQNGRDVWEAATGFNKLYASVRIEAKAAGADYAGDRWFR
jgi:hypothetical protein